MGAPSKATLRSQVTRLRDGLVAVGRGADAAKIYAMATIIVDETAEKAQAKYQQILEVADPEAALVLMSGWMGVDLSKYDLDEPVGNVKSNAIQSTVASFKQEADEGREWTVRDIAEYAKVGGYGIKIIGSPSEVADQLEEWVAETGIDGFNLSYAITPGTFEDVVRWVVPELQKRGVYPTEYTSGSLRNKLHGRGDHLPPDHRGYQYKISK